MKNIVPLCFVFLFLHTCKAGYLKVLYVADSTVACGENKKCLLIRDAPADAWKIFSDTIDGFSPEKGFEYCLLVEVSAADTLLQTSTRYTLNEVKSKTATAYPKTATATASAAIPDSSRWMLYKLKRKDGTKTFSVQKAYLQFDLQHNTVSGNTECNALNAGITIDSAQLKIDNVITTKMACGKHSIEPDFLNALKQTTHYKVTAKLLYLYKGKFLLALFTRKK